MKRIQLEPWTAFDKHCLTSAVSRVGDQNWTAVSRATRNIYEDSIKWLPGGEKRSLEWFSNKQCAAQYEHLLKNVPPRRKKRSERAPEQANITESPAEILQQTCRHELAEELKRTLVEEQAQYLKLLKEYEDILAGRLDHKLEEMQEEYEAKEREKEIKLKLKFKLGEKNMAEASSSTDLDRPPPPPPEVPTTPVKADKETGPEPHKTSVTTSPLLTSLLQSPSPLTRPSSATPTISLILNSSPSVPSNESPTLSKLLESSCPTPTSSTQQLSTTSGSTRALMSAATPQPSRTLVPPSTPLSALVEQPVTSTPHRPVVSLPSPVPIVHVEPPVQKVEVSLPEPSLVPVSLKVKEDKQVQDKDVEQPAEPKLEELVETVAAPEPTKPLEKVEVLPADAISEDKKRGLPRRLDLENLVPEDVDTTELQVMETVEEMIEKVQTAIIETVVDGSVVESVPDVQDVSAIGGSETTTIDEHSLDTLELTTDAVEMIVMGPDPPPCIELNRDPGSNKGEELKEEIAEEVPDIDEIQPSISASDVADLEEPLKERISGGKDALEQKLSPQAASIEQAEADLAAIAREEEEEAVSESINSQLIDKEAVVIVKRVADEWVDREMTKNSEENVDENDDESEEAIEEDIKETDDKVEEKCETVESDMKTIAEVKNHEPKVETRGVEESEEKSVDGSQSKEEASDDEDDAQEVESVSSRPPVDVEEATTGTENTNDSFVDKTMDVEEDVKEDRTLDKGGESKESEKLEKIVSKPTKEEQPEKQKIKSVPGEKPSTKAKDDKREEVLDEKIEEVRTGKRELRRGRATPPVTSSPILSAVVVGERTLREKRPATPSGSSEGKEETTSRTTKRKRTTNLSESSVPCSPSPSIVSIDDDKDYRVWKKSILLAYDRIAAHKYASVFLKPINENDAPGYFQIIRCPTDLTTIKRQIESGLIRTTVDFQKEMLLMISNAIIYNKGDTLVHKMAYEMLPDMKEAMETMVQVMGSGVLLDQPDSRPQASSRVSRASVSAKGLGSDDSSGTPSGSTQSSAKRKRQQPAAEDSRGKRKRSDAS